MRTSANLYIATLGFLSLGAGAALADGESAKLLASDGADGDLFGTSVAIDGTTAIIGAFGDDDNASGAGSAYLFDTISGAEIAKLISSDGAAFDGFGYSVGISGTTAIVGAIGDDDNGADSGAAFLFDIGTGLQLEKILPTDGSAGDIFGVSVAISGTTAIVGAHGDGDNGFRSGSAYLFDTVTGAEEAKLLPNDGFANDEFGYSVSISGTTAIVGSPFSGDNGLLSGSAYLFDTVTGAQTAKLLPADGEAGDQFGLSVGISGTIVIVGAYRDDDNGTESGSAYLFDVGTGAQIGKLLPADGSAGEFFGLSVSINGTTAIVGAYLDDDNGPVSGSAYLFDAITKVQIAKLLSSDGAANDQFGLLVAISGTTALVGANKDDDNGTSSGSAYLFETTTSGAKASTTTRNGSGLNASILTKVTDPILGTNWVTDLDCSGHNPAFATLEVYEGQSAGFFLPGGELLVDVSSTFVTNASQIHFGGVVQFSIAVPNDLALCGFEASAQGVVLGAPGYELSNALDLVAGF